MATAMNSRRDHICDARAARLFRFPPAQGPARGRGGGAHSLSWVRKVSGARKRWSAPAQLAARRWSQLTQRRLGHGGTSAVIRGVRLQHARARALLLPRAPPRDEDCLLLCSTRRECLSQVAPPPRREDCLEPCSTPRPIGGVSATRVASRLTWIVRGDLGSPLKAHRCKGKCLFVSEPAGLSPTGTTQPYSVVLPPVRVGRAADVV